MSRMKYLVNSWGIEKFKAKVEEYLGKPLQPFRPLPKWEFKTYLGWGEQVGPESLCFLQECQTRL